MLNCKDATRLMSEEQDRSLVAGERASLKFHLFICAGCSNFNRQMGALRQICRHYPNASASELEPKSGL